MQNAGTGALQLSVAVLISRANHVTVGIFLREATVFGACKSGARR